MLSPNNHCTGYLPPLQTLCIGKSMEAERLEICRCESVQILQAPNYCLAIASTRLLKAFNYLCYQLLPTVALTSIGQQHRARYQYKVLPNITIGIVKHCPILPSVLQAGWHCGTKSVNGCADLDQTYSNQASALTLFNTVMIITRIIMMITIFNTVMIIIFIIVY